MSHARAIMSRTFGHHHKRNFHWHKEIRAVRRMLNRAHRFACRRAIRRGEEPPRWARTNGWVTW